MITVLYFAAAALYASIGMPAIAIGWLVLGTLRLYWSNKDVKRLALLILLLATPATAAERTQEYYDNLPGVVYTNWFNTQADIDEGFIQVPDGDPTPTHTLPTLETTFGVSGGKCFKFEMPSESSARGACVWFKSYGPYAEGDAFSIQYRQYWAADWFNQFIANQDPKSIVISGTQTADDLEYTATFESGNITNKWISTYTDGGSVGTRKYYNTGPADYYEHWWPDVPIQGAEDDNPGYAAIPAVAEPQKPAGSYLGWYSDRSKMMQLTSGEWWTIQMNIIIGDYDQNNSTLVLRLARENEPSVIVQYRDNYKFEQSPPHNTNFNQFYIGPYMTNKSSSTVHNPAATWYDNIVVREGTTPIPDPYYEPNARVRTRTIGGVR